MQRKSGGIEELRQMGNEALTVWAERGLKKSEPAAEAGCARPVKKRYGHTIFGEIVVMEPLWRRDTRVERRFSERAGGGSLPAVFAALAADSERFRGGSSLRPGAGEAA